MGMVNVGLMLCCSLLYIFCLTNIEFPTGVADCYINNIPAVTGELTCVLPLILQVLPEFKGLARFKETFFTGMNDDRSIQIRDVGIAFKIEAITLRRVQSVRQHEVPAHKVLGVQRGA